MADNIVIFGSGAYVLGDAFGPSPVLRGVLQWARRQATSLAPRDVHVQLVCHSSDKYDYVTQKAAAAAAEVGATHLLQVVHYEEGLRLFGEHPLAAFICVPDEAHAFYLMRAIETGCPAWVVKPLTGELVSAKAAFEAAKVKGADVWVDYHKRFDPSNNYIYKSMIEQSYGDMLHYSVQYTQPRSLPLDAFTWSKTSDAFTYIGCHYVDQLDFLFPGIVPEKVTATGLEGEVFETLGGHCYDLVLAEILCRKPNGKRLMATMQVGWCDPAGTPGKSHQRVEVTFARGRIIADQKVRGLQVWDENHTNEVNPFFFGSRIDPFEQRLTYEGYGIESITRFLDWCVTTPENKAFWRKSTALPWIERSEFTETVLDMVRRSLDADGDWIKV